MNQPNKVGPEVIEHWFSLVHGERFSTNDCYCDITEKIESQEIPNLKIHRVALKEGSIASDERMYLRIKRQRHTFDVCAAPVGTNFFFSYRNYLEPVTVRFWQVLVFVVATYLYAALCIKVMGQLWGTIAFFASGIGLLFLARNALAAGLSDLDNMLVNSPVVGALYERFLRKDTYYRQDMRLAYSSLVSNIVKDEITRMTSAKGVLLVREYDYSPFFNEVYAVKESKRGIEAKAA